jgi:hypothetical protein
LVCDGEGDRGQQKRQPCAEAPEVIADGSEHGVDRVAGRMGKIIAAHAMLGFHVADDRLDGGPSPQLAFDALGDAALLTRDINLEAMRSRRVVTAIAAISDDAIKRRADQPLNLGDDDAERVAIIWFARQGPGVDDELPAFRSFSVVATDALTPNS